MKRNYVILWYFSILSYCFSLIPFFKFMYDLREANLFKVLFFIAFSTILYIIGTKKITLPQGYTIIQSMSFYKACKKAELGKPEQCKKHTRKFKEIAESFDFAKELNQEELITMYEIGYEIYNRKEK